MGDGDVIKKILTTSDMENLSLDVSVSKLSRDLLQRFRGSASEFEVLTEKNEEIELNLGLSLGGRFGVDKSCKSLVRSSSIAVCSPVVSVDGDHPKSTPITGLVRTSSLPVVTEEEWRKRKELQTLRRMEAKRRRSEKQRNLRGDKEVVGIHGGSGGGSLGLEAESGVKRFGSSLEARFGSTSWAGCGGGTDVSMAKAASPGSGSSSCVSDLEGKIRQGSSGEPSPTSSHPLKVKNQDVGSSVTKSPENTGKTTGSDVSASPSKKSDTSRTAGRRVGTNAIEDMPCVFTVGDGPNGRRVDGILYKFGKGEEVRIMCICCGKFHSPAEFVKHAGGTDVDHPLKHIVVNAYASSLL
ncbi:ninja-family protein AFP3-like [Primulina eburnea]|uniref:ninja-family protein AFP3-like n=1 Tax=Primulina eburnea TaxID=1245227 RepID=UPI003C6C4004